MFENLSQRLQQIFQKLGRAGRINENHLNEASREIKLALLEADVHYEVVKNFIKRLQEKALGEKIMESLSPTQQIIKIVNEELTGILGQGIKEIQFSKDGPTSIMLVGLQGSGKTTTAAKLALFLKKNYQPLLVALDPYRPAAIEQLEAVGQRVEAPVFSQETRDINRIVRESLAHAQKENLNCLIFDTAGRLHIDEEMMQELVRIKEISKPTEILLVADAMTGQDAVNLAKTFNEKIGLTGLILTKLDGDSRGGAALSMVSVTGCPIKFAGVGEKLTDLEPFYPDRVASRILGMGDVLSLVEKVEQNIDLAEAEEMEKKFKKNQEFTLADFAKQLKQIQKLGPIEKILGMIPGFEIMKQQNPEAKIDSKELIRIEAMICSMTPAEREEPDILDGPRRLRITRGSGTKVEELNRFLKRFVEAKKMLKRMREMMAEGKNPLPSFLKKP